MNKEKRNAVILSGGGCLLAKQHTESKDLVSAPTNAAGLREETMVSARHLPSRKNPGLQGDQDSHRASCRQLEDKLRSQLQNAGVMGGSGAQETACGARGWLHA